MSSGVVWRTGAQVAPRPALAITTSMVVMLWVVLRVFTASNGSVGDRLSILRMMRVVPAAVGREVSAAELVDGLRTVAMMVWFGRRR